MEVQNNQLSGNLPEDFSQLTSLNYFDASFNQLRGSMPNRWPTSPGYGSYC